ncbi:MAG TPA: molybdopterin cofactor-binding domain-containing protein, partial [Geminicoccaceae bacterium]|nr:molybdopterin cofactor-binding domain-containing protein [Geminicoccaceae bacterium]
CGACTVLLEGVQVCACLVALGQVEGRRVATVEGLAQGDRLCALQRAFQRHGAAQCGICTPGMLMAASDLLARNRSPCLAEVTDALGGVLCRCTGYRKIVTAVLDVADLGDEPGPSVGGAVGARLGKVDGPPKLTGRERYGADGIPGAALWLKVIRSPHASATFALGDPKPLLARHPGLLRVLTAADVPVNGFGIYPHLKDQPVLADGVVRYRGEAVAALLGEREAIEAVRADDVPVRYRPLPAVSGVDAATARGAPLVQADKPGNLLIEGVVRSGDGEAALARCAAVAEGCFTTAFVEHAYIEPEAGWARRVGDRIEVHATTQSPYLDRDETARVLRIAPERVRILPTACGGGFGGKLDVSVQPLLALAASMVDRPVALVYERPESMASSTKRHPARIRARLGCDAEGRLQAFAATADFDTGAYASWGPAVAGRVPVHAMGPYRVPHVAARGRALFTNGPPSGAFRGFGVPQAAIAHEALMDDLALRLGIDRLSFRLRNALRAGDLTATGQRLAASVGLAACLEALRPRWQGLLDEVDAFNLNTREHRQGIGIGCMWYGIGNTALPHPSTIRLGLTRAGRLVLYSGAVDIGQGANTILSQIAADALGVPVARIDLVTGDTDRTADAGKTSASRQTFVSGKATELAARELRAAILRRINAGPDAALTLADGAVLVREAGRERRLGLAGLDADADGVVLLAEGHFDPPSAPLDRDGQGSPYPTYAFAAQIARVQVDLELGTTRVLEIVAAHDVGRAINPTQVEGQIEGGIAQGLGMALMEEYLPGRTENLHDYLIPTFGDVPPIEVILIEDPEPLGPFGAKGVGEPGLIPTAPAILGAIRHATGVRVTRVPALPHRLRAAILAREGGDG